MKPSVGRIVHYVGECIIRDAPDGDGVVRERSDGLRCYAAMIVDVENDGGRVALHVFRGPTGGSPQSMIVGVEQSDIHVNFSWHEPERV